jgi:predicted TPR repeat methyltransferase
MRKLWSSLKRFRDIANAAWRFLTGIKDKIKNFDIKPAKPIVPELIEKAEIAFYAGDHALAEKYLYKALARNNTNIHILKALIELQLAMGKYTSAIHLLKHAIKHHPDKLELHERLGSLLAVLGKRNAAAKAFKKIVQSTPDNVGAKHFLDATTSKHTAIAPREYVVGLFDDYAPNFEQSLINLSYRTPVKLADSLAKRLDPNNPIEHVLDLGCGTGWAGEYLSQKFKIQNLVGVDLSANMLEQAKTKNVYHALHNSDLIDYLRINSPQADLITCTDVLVYIGDLEPVMAECYRCLKPGAYLAFSVERLWFGQYKLQSSGRYHHSLSYIKSLYKHHHFSKMYSQSIDLRRECGNMIAGYLVLFQK